MEEERNRSSEALNETENKNSEPPNEVEEGNRDEKTERIDEQRRLSSDSTSNSAVGNSSSGGESRASEFETLSSVQLSEGDFQADFDKSSHLLSGSSTVPSFVLCVCVCICFSFGESAYR